MNKSLLMFTLLFAVCCCVVQAAPCASGNLASYIAGPGCTIDGILFSGFSYTNPASGGGVSPDATGVSVTPITGTEFGFDFTGSWLAGSGQTADGNITYTATCQGCLISDLQLIMNGVGSGTGVASVIETSPSPVVALSTDSTSSFTKLSDSTLPSFSPVGSITVTKDIGASGGTNGVGHVSGVENLFSTNNTVPEPSMLLFGAGVLVAIPIARRRRARKAS